MESIKTYLIVGLIKLFLLGISVFFGNVVMLKYFYSRIRYGSKYFHVKERTLPPPCLQDPAFKHSYIKIKSVKLHIVEAGDHSKPLMLFVHGFPEFWFSWRHQLKHFAKDYWVVAFDLRGYGDSDKPRGVGSYKVEKLTDDIVSLVHALGRQSCIVVGHDWGGVIAWYTAGSTTTTSVIDKLIILNAAHPGASLEKRKRSWKQFLKSWYIFFFQLPILPEHFAVANDIELFDRILVRSDGSRPSSEIVEAYKYTFGKSENWTPPINYYRASFSAWNFYNTEYLKLSKISQPTLIIWGEKDIALEPDLPELSIAYCTGLTEIHRIKNGNHFIQNDQPNEVNAAIEKFLAKN